MKKQLWEPLFKTSGGAIPPLAVEQGGGEVPTFSFKRTGIDRSRLHNALRLMGRENLHSKDMEWSVQNPTRNFCYVISEWLHRYYMPTGSLTFKVAIKGEEELHRFNIWPDGAVVDLSCEQFGENFTVPYHTAEPFTLMQSGGPAPSRRAQLLEWLYRGHSQSSFHFRKEKGDWKHPANCLDLPEFTMLSRWIDPYPEPVIKRYGRFRVVRDDLLGVGSKARFIDALLFRQPEIKEWVYGSCPAQGYGQVSLAAAAKNHDKRAVLFMAARSKDNLLPQQKQGMKLGATYKWVENGFLNVTEKQARDYVAEKEHSRKLLRLGLDDPTIRAAIVKVARSLECKHVHEIWTVGGSGVLSRSLQLTFPKAKVNVVSVGHTLRQEEIGRARLWRHPLKFTQNVSEEDMPPYPSLQNYDAKVWSFAEKYGSDNALIWNVA